MTKRKNKNGNASLYRLLLTVIALAVVAILIPIGIFDVIKEKAPAIADGTVEIHFIDVGQGDGILIRTEDGDIVIDAGPSESENDYLRYLKSYGIDDVEYLFLTHPHGDHIGGADLMLSELSVKRVVIPKTDCTTSIYMKVLQLADRSGAEIVESEVNKTFSLGGLTLTSLAPHSITYEGYNDYSIVLRAEFGDTSFLLVGDAEALSESEMLEKISVNLLDCDVLKVGHHGSSTSSSENFLSAVTPQYAVISCGENNDFGHPHSDILERFAELQANERLFRTDKDGHIVFVSDGKSITVRTSK